MKTFTLIVLGVCLNIICAGQQITTSVGRLSTAFNYLNSENQELDNLHSVNGFHYSLGYRFTFTERLYVKTTAVYNNYAKEGSDPELDNYYKWDTKYLGLSISPEFEFFQFKNFRIAAQADLSPQFLVTGQQTINNQVFSLKGVEQFDSPFLFMRGGLTSNYCLDDKVALSLSYFYGQGTPFSKSTDGEQLKLRSSTFSIGLHWSIKKCKYCAPQRTNK